MPTVCGELVVGEVQPAEAVGPGEHPDAEEQQEARDPEAPGDQRRQQASGQQRAGHEHHLAYVHLGMFSGTALRSDPEALDRAPDDARDLHLRNADDLTDLGLRHVLAEAEGQHGALAG